MMRGAAGVVGDRPVPVVMGAVWTGVYSRPTSCKRTKKGEWRGVSKDGRYLAFDEREKVG
jgi:hypothetical protein